MRDSPPVGQKHTQQASINCSGWILVTASGGCGLSEAGVKERNAEGARRTKHGGFEVVQRVGSDVRCVCEAASDTQR